MKNMVSYLVVLVCIGGLVSANGESLLKPASFPKVFNDAPFIARIQTLAEGYDDYESVYDANGRCISGCAYPGITMEKETEAIERNSRIAQSAAQQYNYPNGNIVADNVVVPEQQSNTNVVMPNVSNQPTTNLNPPAASTPPTPSQQTYNCATHRAAYRTLVPGNSPIDIDIHISSDFGPRKSPTAGASSWHKGIDISIPTGTPVYATADGTVEYIRDQGNKGGGKYIVIKHGNTNFRTAYFHLSNNQVLKVGDFVNAGCLVGISGNTGVSTGPHLHYTIYYTQPGKSFNFALDPVDPLWTENQLKTNYRFKSQAAKSCLHTAHNFCGTGAVPPDTLPGEIK